jgi:DUF1680 family protein
MADAANRHAFPVDLRSVNVSGQLDTRIGLGLSHLLAVRDRILSGEGHTQTWGVDGLGRWVDAVAAATMFGKDHLPILDETAQLLLRSQQPNGFFSTRLASGTWFGASRALLGLLAYWEATRNPEALDSAQRLGDFYRSNLPQETTWNWMLTPLEGLVALSRATGNQDYLRFAEKLTGLVEVDPEFGDPDGEEHSYHTHSYLLAMRGFVDLFSATAKPKFLEHAQEVWDRILRRNMWVSGGISEGSTYPFETRDETCSIADWFRLSLSLWQATRDPKYMDVAEHTLLNHLYFDQDHSGGFCTYRSIRADSTARSRDDVAWWCCSMHGPRTLLEAGKFIYTHDDDGIDVNLFTASDAVIPLKDGKVRLSQITTYPSEPVARLELQPQSEISFSLSIRIPRWTRSFQMTLNGEPHAVTPAPKAFATASSAHLQMPEQGYASIKRLWKPGDVVEIGFDPYLRLVPADQNSFSAPAMTHAPADTGKVELAALLYGPLVLMFDPSLTIHQMYDWCRAELMIPQRDNGELFLPKAQASIPGRKELSVPGMCFMTLARKWEEGGEPAVPDDESWKLAFLVPISEITDRWTPSRVRHVPYEVRNDLWILDEAQTESYLARVQTLLGSFSRERSGDTI